MLYVKAINARRDQFLIADTEDDSAEWCPASMVVALCRTGTQVFGVRKENGRVVISAMPDPREYLLERLRLKFGRFYYDFQVDKLSTQCLGDWVAPEYAKYEDSDWDEEDYDWKVLSDNTALAVSNILSQIEQETGYRFCYSVGEKECLYFSADRKSLE